MKNPLKYRPPPEAKFMGAECRAGNHAEGHTLVSRTRQQAWWKKPAGGSVHTCRAACLMPDLKTATFVRHATQLAFCATPTHSDASGALYGPPAPSRTAGWRSTKGRMGQAVARGKVLRRYSPSKNYSGQILPKKYYPKKYYPKNYHRIKVILVIGLLFHSRPLFLVRPSFWTVMLFLVVDAYRTRR